MLLSVILYLVLAALIVTLSMKLSDYVDLLDRTTDISGAFLGGVMLAAVTSLPELLTTISSVLLVKQPDLVMGNILGSNLFNLTVLGTLMVIGVKKFARYPVSKSHRRTMFFVCTISAVLVLNLFVKLDVEILTVSLISLLIMGLYIVSVRTMSEAGNEEAPEEEVPCALSPKQLFFRFGLCSAALIATSICITYVTDLVAEEFQLGRTFAGALLLATATSLPELVSASSLLRKSNINAMVGDIVGSNLFNFTILVVADLLMLHQSIYAMNSQALYLLGFGCLSTLAMTAALCAKCSSKGKNYRALYLLCGLVCASGYLLFLAVGR